LVAVVAGAKIAGSEKLGEGDLGQFFAITEDAKLGLAAHHLAPPNEADLAALVDEAIVVEEVGGERECSIQDA
jgi:hypothetical protein